MPKNNRYDDFQYTFLIEGGIELFVSISLVITRLPFLSIVLFNVWMLITGKYGRIGYWRKNTLVASSHP